MRNFSFAVAALAALLGSAAAGQAAFSDDFSTSQATSTNNASSGFDTGSTLMTTANISRTIQTDILSNTAPGDARGRTAILNGNFSFSSDDGVTGLGYLTYSFSTPISLALTPLFDVTLLSNDDSGYLHLFVYDTSGAVASAYYTLPNIGTGSPVPVDILVASNLPGVNSASVSKLVFAFGGRASEDLGVDAITAVPEPGTLGLVTVLGSLAGAGLLFRRQRMA